MKKIMPLVVVAAFLLLLACAPTTSTVQANCVVTANGKSALPPCWLNTPPTSGLVLEGTKHIGSAGWANAKKQLLKEAMLEFAIARYGEEVTTSSVVVKDVRVDGNDNVNKVARVLNSAVFSIGDKAVNVKAKIEDFYYYPITETAYVWVTEIQQ